MYGDDDKTYTLVEFVLVVAVILAGLTAMAKLVGML